MKHVNIPSGGGNLEFLIGVQRRDVNIRGKGVNKQENMLIYGGKL